MPSLTTKTVGEVKDNAIAQEVSQEETSMGNTQLLTQEKPKKLSAIEKLFNPKEGFEKGNLFPNIYEQYKNYRPETLRASNEQEKLFLELSRTFFLRIAA